MSVKFKIAAILLSAFLVNVTCLMLYYQFVTLNQIKIQTHAFLESFESVSSQIADTIRKHNEKSNAVLLQKLQETFENEPYAFSIVDENNQVLFSMNNDKKKGMPIRNKVIFQSRDGNTYEIRVSQHLNIPTLQVESSITKLIIFGSILLFLTLITVLLYMNFAVSKPLIALRSMMDGLYKRGTPAVKPMMGDEIKLLNQGFQKMSEELRKSKNSQDELISSISHDIKNPLTSILGYTERLLETKSLSEERKEKYHKIIHSRAVDIKNMIDEFSTYMEGESGNFTYEEVSLYSLVCEMAAEYTDELSGINRSFIAQYDIPENSLVMMDVNKIKRVGTNIISNSVKYAGEEASIYFYCHAKNGWAIFSFEDTGKGVDEEELNRVFDLMYRCGAERNQGKDKTGSGLGLTICKRIIELHGGTIEAFSSEKGGLGIRFLLPMTSEVKD